MISQIKMKPKNVPPSPSYTFLIEGICLSEQCICSSYLTFNLPYIEYVLSLLSLTNLVKLKKYLVENWGNRSPSPPVPQVSSQSPVEPLLICTVKFVFFKNRQAVAFSYSPRAKGPTNTLFPEMWNIQ